MTYAFFYAPAALPVAVLTLVVVPFLSLIVFMIGLLAAGAAVVALAATVVVVPLQSVNSNRHRRVRTANTQLDARQSAVGSVTGDSERRLSCS